MLMLTGCAGVAQRFADISREKRDRVADAMIDKQVRELVPGYQRDVKP